MHNSGGMRVTLTAWSDLAAANTSGTAAAEQLHAETDAHAVTAGKLSVAAQEAGVMTALLQECQQQLADER